MRRTGGLVVLLLTLVVGACKPTLPAHDYSRERDPRKRGFVLGPSDRLTITVWKNPDLTTDATVRPDGTITLPLIGDIQAAGRTPAEVRQEIERRIKAYVKDQAIVLTVAVTAVNSYHFIVSGQVNNPGLFTARRYMTVAEAIAMAGGPTRFAKQEEAIIIRKTESGKYRNIPIDIKAISEGKRPEMNLYLLAGDTIHVP